MTVTAETELKALPYAVTPLAISSPQPGLFQGFARVDADAALEETGGPGAGGPADWLPVDRPSYRLTHFAGYKPRAQLLRFNEFRKRMWNARASA